MNLLTINKEIIPHFLKQSILFRAFDDPKISVPTKYMMNSYRFTNIIEFDKVIDMFRYWQIDELPISIYDMIGNVRNEEFIEKFNEQIKDKYNDFPFINSISALINHKNEKDLFAKIGENDCRSLLNYKLTNDLVIKCNSGTSDVDTSDNLYKCWTQASKYGNLEILKILFATYPENDSFACNESAAYGNYDNMIYLEKHGVKWVIDKCAPGLYDIACNGFCRTDKSVSNAQENHFKCLKYASKKSVPMDLYWCEESQSDEDYMFKGIIDKALKTNDKLADTSYFKCLKYIIENDLHDYDLIDTYTFDLAVGVCGNIEFFNYMTSYYDNAIFDLKLRIGIMCGAASENHFEFMKYIYDKCKIIMIQFDQHGYYLNCSNIAADTGNLEMLKWTHARGGKCTIDVCETAAGKNNVECLKYAINEYRTNKKQNMYNHFETEQEKIDSIYDGSIEHGYIECMKILHQHGFELTIKTFEIAAKYNQLECLKYLHQFKNKFAFWKNPLKSDVCGIAEKNGNYECFKWAFDNRYEWRGIKKIDIIEKKRLDCLNYILDNCTDKSKKN